LLWTAAAGLLVVALGAMVFLLAGDRDDSEEATDAAAGAGADGVERGPGPRIAEDHWHSAYAIWVCDRFVDPLTDLNADALGIHTHDDGLIHIHPTSELAAGPNATLGVFADEVGVEFTDSGFSLPSGETYETGDDCEGTDAVVQVLEWRPHALPDDAIVHTDDFGSIPLDSDSMGFTIAFMRPDTPVEDLYPPSIRFLEEPSDVAPDAPRSVDELPPPQPVPGSVALPDFTGDGELLFRPVLAVLPPDAGDGFEELLPGSDGFLYELGTPLPADLVESARAELDPGGMWTVAIRFREGRPGVDDFNDVAELCFERAAECPTGQIAMVLEDFVISAPSVQAPSFERDEVQVTGEFTEQQAREIAAVIS
jgi:hypothetical protein